MKKSVWIALFVVLVLGLAGLLAGLYFYNLPQKDLNQVKPDYVITAVDVLNEFATNESAATTKYVDKTLEITGSISQVKTVDGKVKSIILNTGNPLSSVICDLRNDADPDDINARKSITIRGELSGFLMDILLNNCVIVK